MCLSSSDFGKKKFSSDHSKADKCLLHDWECSIAHWSSMNLTSIVSLVYEIPGFIIWLNQEGTCIRRTNLSNGLQANRGSIVFNLEKYCIITILRAKITVPSLQSIQK